MGQRWVNLVLCNDYIVITLQNEKYVEVFTYASTCVQYILELFPLPMSALTLIFIMQLKSPRWYICNFSGDHQANMIHL